MAGLGDKPLVWLKGEGKSLRSVFKPAWKLGCFSGVSSKDKVESAPFATNARNRSPLPRVANQRSRPNVANRLPCRVGRNRRSRRLQQEDPGYTGSDGRSLPKAPDCLLASDFG
jgi:hypothetical protein